MKKTIIISTMIALLGFCLGTLSTCKEEGKKEYQTEVQDTIFLRQWRFEKQKRLNLITFYETKLAVLEKGNDSLSELVKNKKQTISAYRLKEKLLQDQLKIKISHGDTTLAKTDLNSIADSLIIASENSEAACDTTIRLLEEKLTNRDSTIMFHEAVEDNLREEQRDQEFRSQYLTEQLNLSNKNLKRKTRQNKVLAGGLLILSGITTSILITNSQK